MANHKKYKTLKEKDFFAYMAEVNGISVETAKRSAKYFRTAIESAMVEDYRVTILNFGTFHTNLRKASESKNPYTGAIIPVPPIKGVNFRVAEKFKEKLNEDRFKKKNPENEQK